MIWLRNQKHYISKQLILVFIKKMKKILIHILIIVGLFSFVLANNEEIENEGLLTYEEEMTIELEHDDIPANPTQEQREIRCNQKQIIKSRILDLYKEIKNNKDRENKKEIRSQISFLKKELWKINSKIAYSYKQQFRRFFWFK